MNRLLTFLTITVIAAACNATTETQTDAGPDQTSDRIEIEPIDPATASDVGDLFLADADPDRVMAAGPWFSDAFSTPIVFDLPRDGKLAEDGGGILVVEIGEPDSTDGSIEIVEPVAFAGIDEPVPIGDTPTDEAWGGATAIDSGTVESSAGLLSWVDVIYESENIDENRTFGCPYEADNPCIDAVVTAQGALAAELERVHRYVRVEIDGTQFVVSTLAPGRGAQYHGKLALDVAASLTPAPARTASASDGVRSIEELETVGAPMPAGEYVAEIDGATLTFDLENDLEGVKFNGLIPELMIFTNPGETVGLGIFRFQGFVSDIDARRPTLDEPLTNEEYFGALEQIVEVTFMEETSIGDLPAVRFGLATDNDPAFDCSDEQRDMIGLSDDVEQCMIFAEFNFGLPTWTNECDRETECHAFYISSLGLNVDMPVGANDPNGSFATLVDSLELTAP